MLNKMWKCSKWRPVEEVNFLQNGAHTKRIALAPSYLAFAICVLQNNRPRNWNWAKIGKVRGGERRELLPFSPSPFVFFLLGLSFHAFRILKQEAHSPEPIRTPVLQATCKPPLSALPQSLYTYNTCLTLFILTRWIGQFHRYRRLRTDQLPHESKTGECTSSGFGYSC